MIFVAGMLVWFLSFALCPSLLFFLGLKHYGVWFLDSYAILAANDAQNLGLNAYAPNPLDPFGRPHVYSHWWLYLSRLRLTRDQNLWVGLVIVASFLTALFLQLRPRNGRQMCWYFAFACCPPVLLAVNRANNDLVVFSVLAGLPWAIWSESRVIRWLSVLLVALGAGLKFYPAVTFLLLLGGESSKENRMRMVVTVLLLILVGANVASDIERFIATPVRPDGLTTFGASNLFERFGVRPIFAQIWSFVVATVAIGIFWRSPRLDVWAAPAADSREWHAFLLAALLLTGCFLTGSNYGYRWVFAIWTAPALWHIAFQGENGMARHIARVTAALLLGALWFDSLMGAMLASLAKAQLVSSASLVFWAESVFLLEQPFIWALFLLFLGYLTAFVRTASVCPPKAAAPV